MRIYNKIASMIKRTIIKLVGDDNKKVSFCQVSYMGKTAFAETIYPYGFSAKAPINSMALAFNIGCNESNMCVLPYSQQERFNNLVSGEVCVGSPVTGGNIKFSQDGDTNISAKNNNVLNNAKITNLTANRLIASNTDKSLASTNLINWVHSTSLIITDDGIGGININLP